jgi:hypothetical protein
MCELLEERIRQERLEDRAEAVCAMVKNMEVSVERALNILNIPENEKESYRKAVAEATTN